MGLKQYQVEKIIEEFLSSYGITKLDLIKLHSMLEKVEKIEENKPKALSKAELEQIEKENAKKMTPEDMIKQFTQEVEEFYPNGNAPRHNN